MGTVDFYFPAGINGTNDPARPDNIIYDMGPASQGNIKSDSAFGHVDCGLGESKISADLPAVSTAAPVTPKK